MQGVPESVKKVNAALQQGTADTIRWTDQYGVAHEVVGQTGTAAAKLNTILGVNARKLSEDTAKAQELAVASGDLRKALKGVQDRGKIVTDFETNGYPETTRDIANLVDKYDLARKDVKTSSRRAACRPPSPTCSRFSTGSPRSRTRPSRSR